MTCQVVDISYPLLGGTKSIPFLAIFVEGLTFIGKSKVYGRVILQPSGKEIDTVVDVRRGLDEIIETVIDLARRRCPNDSAGISGICTDLFHSQDIPGGRVGQYLFEELGREPFRELRDAGGGHGWGLQW
jgi:hypothetical protein